MKALFIVLAVSMALAGCVPTATAQSLETAASQHADSSEDPGQEVTLRKFLIERTIPGLGEMSPEELSAVTAASNAVLDGMNKSYHWVQSFVTGDKMYCIHIAPDEETVREHARRGGFPADRIVEITGTIDPTSAGSTGQ